MIYFRHFVKHEIKLFGFFSSTFTPLLIYHAVLGPFVFSYRKKYLIEKHKIMFRFPSDCLFYTIVILLM